MKIAIIHNQFARGGGMEAYMLSLVKGFLGAGDQVSIYTYEVDKQLASQYPCSIHQLKPLPLPGKWRKYLFIRKCNKVFDAKRYTLSLSLTRTSCQDIAVCGGVHPEVVKRVKRTSLFRNIHDRFEIGFEKNMLETVPRVMAHSSIIARELQDNYQFDPKKLVTFFPPIDTDTFYPVNQDEIIKTVQQFGISKNKLTFLFPSCGHQCKGMQPLVIAFSRLDPARFELLVAGDPVPGKTPSNVRHIGYIKNLAPLYTSVDFTILPSDYEAFGLVIPESLQCQTPVITTQAVGAAELLSEEDGIIMNDNLPETIVETVAGLIGRQFTVPSNFAEKHRLTIEQHIADIKSLVPAS
jgi:glycosyltransferase involved in cell wall biosynthesis